MFDIKIHRVKSYFSSQYYTNVFPQYIHSTKPALMNRECDYEIHILTCAAHITMLLWALKSYSWANGGLPGVVIHDDGSLSERDVETLRLHFPDAALISDETAGKTQSLRRLLDNYPALKYWRFEVDLCLARRLVDFSFFSKREYIVVFDCDVLFFRGSHELADCLQSKTPFASTDCIDAYYPTRSELAQSQGLHLPPRLNGGLFGTTTEMLDLGKIDSFLAGASRDDPDGYFDWGHFWLDQTMLAMLLPGHASFRQLNIAYHGIGFQRLTNSSCSHHYPNGGTRRLYYRAGLRRLDALGILSDLHCESKQWAEEREFR